MTLLIDVQIIPGSLVEQDWHVPSAAPVPCLDGHLGGKGFALICSKLNLILSQWSSKIVLPWVLLGAFLSTDI